MKAFRLHALVCISFLTIMLFSSARASAATGPLGMSTFQASLSAVGSGLCLDVPGVVATSGLVLPQAGCVTPAEQLFSFVTQTDGSYILYSPASTYLCVDVNDSGVIVQNYCLPTASQKWLQTLNADGSYSFTNAQTSQCMSLTPPVTGTPATFSMAACNGTPVQEFTFALAQPFTPSLVQPVRQAPPLTPIAKPTVGIWQPGMLNGLPYRILFPSGYDPTRYMYPITLYLHGAGESGTDNLKQLLNDVHALPTDMDFRSKVPMILVAPQCPMTDNWGYAYSSTPTQTETLAVQLMQTLVPYLAVDSTRVSVTGLSMGGLGAWDMINRYPVLFAAAAPLAGAGNPANVPNLVKVPIMAVHGSADTVIPAYFDEYMYAQIHARNGAMIYYELAGVGHDVWDLIYPLTSFWQWISSQKHI